jgi:hypothetical protein
MLPLTRNLAMKPQEVTDALKLTQLKDKIWFVVPSCATTGEGLLEGLVGLLQMFLVGSTNLTRRGSRITSNHLPKALGKSRKLQSSGTECKPTI